MAVLRMRAKNFLATLTCVCVCVCVQNQAFGAFGHFENRHLNLP